MNLTPFISLLKSYFCPNPFWACNNKLKDIYIAQMSKNMLMKRVSKLCSILFFTCIFQVIAQDIAIGQWRDHLAYKRGTALTKANEKVYCVADGNLFAYNTSDNSVERCSKVAGFSDIQVNKVAFNEAQQTVVIGYQNTNIDLIKNNTIINLPDIKRKQILGDKTIYNIFMLDKYAYISCGFGIVVIDLLKLEVKDTYTIITNNTTIGINDFTADANNFYAAGTDGVYMASRNNPFLSDNTAWTKIAGLPNAKFNTITTFNNEILFNQIVGAANGRIWRYTPNTNQLAWIDSAIDYSCNLIRTYNDNLMVIFSGNIVLYNSQFGVAGLKSNYDNRDPREALISDGYIWIADYNNTLVKNKLSDEVYEKTLVNGPISNKAYDIAVRNKNVWVVPGDLDGWFPLYNIDGISHFSNNTWVNTPGDIIFNQYGCFDFINAQISPDNPEVMFAASWGTGLIEMNGDSVKKYYNNANSTLALGAGSSATYVGGTKFDNNGNLWVSNGYTNNSISVYNRLENEWNSYPTQNEIGSTRIGKICINSLNQKWCVLPVGGGILVFDHNETLDNKGDDKLKKLTFAAGNGGISGSDVLDIQEDLNGEMWVGTDKGICVFYAPSNVFDQSGFDAQLIKIEQGGYVEYLLDGETVKTIAIDGANRKWIGTANSGLYLVNADGTKQLEHFTIDNSPLLSNDINDLEIDGESGEIYIATSRGIVSYKYTATEGKETFENIYAYPNPVKPNYNGLIAIKGLVKDCDVKITDISGRLIYSTKSLGGQAIWDGKNFEGRKAETGVYLVFCSNSDGSKTEVTKILFVN